jgi:hypothetical protein
LRGEGRNETTGPRVSDLLSTAREDPLETLETILNRIEGVTLPELRDQLLLLEVGEVRTAKSVSGRPWVDDTATEIARVKLAIEQHEKTVIELRKVQALSVSALLRQR